MSLRTRDALALASTAVLTLALAACGGSGTARSTPAPSAASPASFSPGTTMARLAAARKVTVGTKFDQPGFGERQLNGKPTGFDVEIAKIITARLGIPADAITYKEAKSAVREELIERGDVDLIIATYTINDRRKQRVSFAGPYYVAGQQIMVRSDNSTITGPDSLRSNASARVCSVAGSTPAQNIRKYLAGPAQLVTFDVYGKCADALRTGQVSAVTTDNVILLGLVHKSNGTFKVVGNTFTAEPYGIGLKKGDVAFCEFVNNTLSQAASSGAYANAWTSTAGKIKSAAAPQLPPAAACS